MKSGPAVQRMKGQRRAKSRCNYVRKMANGYFQAQFYDKASGKLEHLGFLILTRRREMPSRLTRGSQQAASAAARRNGQQAVHPAAVRSAVARASRNM